MHIFFSFRFINIEPSAVDEERIPESNNEKPNTKLNDDDVVEAATVSELPSKNLNITNASMSPSLSTNLWSNKFLSASSDVRSLFFKNKLKSLWNTVNF